MAASGPFGDASVLAVPPPPPPSASPPNTVGGATHRPEGPAADQGGATHRVGTPASLPHAVTPLSTPDDSEALLRKQLEETVRIQQAEVASMRDVMAQAESAARSSSERAAAEEALTARVRS